MLSVPLYQMRTEKNLTDMQNFVTKNLKIKKCIHKSIWSQITEQRLLQAGRIARSFQNGAKKAFSYYNM